MNLIEDTTGQMAKRLLEGASLSIFRSLLLSNARRLDAICRCLPSARLQRPAPHQGRTALLLRKVRRPALYITPLALALSNIQMRTLRSRDGGNGSL